jgi:mono/diheme cytochrome c family protein
MKRVLLTAAVAWVTANAAILAGWSPRDGVAPDAPTLAQATQNAVMAPADPVADHRAMLNQYCATCHNQRSAIPSADPLYLDDSVDLANLEADWETWEKVIRKLGVGAMPPQGLPHPGEARLTAFRDWLAGSLDEIAAANDDPGEFVLHRLNRTEYAKAVRDLLGLEVDVTALLPPDSSEFGFDNIASVLQVTPALLERYLTAAMRISALAVGDAGVEATEYRQPVRLDFTQTGHVPGLPLGTRGGTVVPYNFPADGEYTMSASLFRPVDNADTGIEGQDTPTTFEILVDGVRVHAGEIGGIDDHLASRDNMTAAREAVAERMRATVFVTAGPHDVGFTFVDRPGRSQDVYRPFLRSSQDIHVGSEEPKLVSVSIAGPTAATGVSNTPSRERLFVCSSVAGAAAGTGAACAEEIFSTFARRAYRRPVTGADLAPLLEFYEMGRAGGGSFDDGVRAALPRVLASPSFLFRSEVSPEAVQVGAAHLISDLELASRLSFFLWSSIPDDELLTLAEQERLREPGVLEAQVRRMLADARAEALTVNFPDQWLALRNMERTVPDLLMFPDWDLNLRESLRQETLLLFDDVARNDRSAMDLLNADWTFMNERLARHYGVEGVYGSAFRRVAVDDPNRYGILGHASVLAMTSVATRTSPVFRGKWILTNILNVPPGLPPDDVPALEENTGAVAPRSVRERLEQHRANPVCASCHRSMDPIGFALEHFDVTGQWRDLNEAGTPVDAAGILLDGTPIDGPVALREAIASRPDVFVGTVTEKLLIYALGRGLEPFDMPVVRGILREASADDYRFTSIITGIVESRPFQSRTKLAPTGTQSAD